MLSEVRNSIPTPTHPLGTSLTTPTSGACMHSSSGSPAS
jgi:hypothetical protein